MLMHRAFLGKYDAHKLKEDDVATAVSAAADEGHA
jgi:hypothetical protein